MSGNLLLPKEEEINRTGSGGMALLHYKLNYEHWEFRLETGVDRGRDCIIEYIMENEWHNNIIQCQVKGTKTPETYLLKNEDVFSYNLDKKYINYALGSTNASVLFLCDLKNEVVYYLPVQEFFINNPDKYINLRNTKTESLNVHIPVTCTVDKNNDIMLRKLSQTNYTLRDGVVYRV